MCILHSVVLVHAKRLEAGKSVALWISFWSTETCWKPEYVTHKTKSDLRSFGCCPQRNGKFRPQDCVEDTPNWACLKAFLWGIPVPVAERE
jgi:hypothetical protein